MSSPPRPRRISRTTVAVLLVALAACTDDPAAPAATALTQPPETAFREGSCRVAAPDVLALGRDAARLGDGPMVPEDVGVSMADAQGRLAELQEGVEAELSPAFIELVVATGFVRIRADGNTYERDLGARMSNAYDALVALCTGTAPTSGTAPTPASSSS